MRSVFVSVIAVALSGLGFPEINAVDAAVPPPVADGPGAAQGSIGANGRGVPGAGSIRPGWAYQLVGPSTIMPEYAIPGRSPGYWRGFGTAPEGAPGVGGSAMYGGQAGANVPARENGMARGPFARTPGAGISGGVPGTTAVGPEGRGYLAPPAPDAYTGPMAYGPAGGGAYGPNGAQARAGMGPEQETYAQNSQNQQNSSGSAESPGGEQQGSGSSGEQQEGSNQSSQNHQQQSNNSSPNQQTPSEPPQGAGDIDSAFLKSIAKASVGEIQLGRLGAQKAKSKKLSSLGGELAHDYQKAYQKLQNLASQKHVALPTSPDLEQQLALKKLNHADDKELAKELLQDEASFSAKLQMAKDRLHDDQLKKEAEDLINKSHDHLDKIKQVAESVGVSKQTVENTVRTQLQAVGAAESGTGEQLQGQAESKSGSESSGEQQEGSNDSGQTHQQQPNNSSPNQQTPSEPPQGAGDIDSAFLKSIAKASVGEIQLGRLGAQKAKSDKLSSLGGELADDYQKAYQKLQKLASQEKVSLPKSPDLEQQLALKKLNHADDKELAKEFLQDEASLLGKLQVAKGQLHNDQLKKEAEDLIQKSHDHLDKIKQVAQSVGVSKQTVENTVRTQLQAVGAAESGTGEQVQGHGESESKASSQTSNQSKQNTDPGVSQLKLQQFEKYPGAGPAAPGNGPGHF